jgi:hypothetical protein
MSHSFCLARWWAILLLGCLALAESACAHIKHDKDPLVQVWVAPRPLGIVRSCIIKGLDENERTYSKISPSIRHRAKTISPDGTVEIRPIHRHEVVDVNYYVRLEKIHDVITRIAFHSSEGSTAKKATAKAISRCGTTP